MFSHWKTCRIILDEGRSLDTEAEKNVINILKTKGVKKIIFDGWRSDVKKLSKYCEYKNIESAVEISVLNSDDFYSFELLSQGGLNCIIRIPLKILLDNKNYFRRLNKKIEVSIIIGKKYHEKLLDGLKFLSKIDIVSGVKIEIKNTCPPYHSSFWRDRKAVIDKEKFSAEDSDSLKRIVSEIKEKKKKYKVINSRDYLDAIPNFGITQNWRCKYWSCPVVASDGCLMPCRQRNLISPLSIFEVRERRKEMELKELSIETSRSCTGCFQEDKFEEEQGVRREK